MPLTSCWRNSVTAAWSPSARRSRIDGRVVDLLAVLDLEHHRRLGRVAMIVERDVAGHAGIVRGPGDDLAQLVLRRLAGGRVGVRRAERLEGGGILLAEL